jgi:hypothetical protein
VFVSDADEGLRLDGIAAWDTHSSPSDDGDNR